MPITPNSHILVCRIVFLILSVLFGKVFKSAKDILSMEKKKVITGLLILIIMLLAIFAIIEYNKNLQLNIRNNQLEADRAQISKDKEDVMNQFEQYRIQSQNDHLKYNMLLEDVAKIYKTCITQNACKGRYPGIRWDCNNVGDEVSTNPSHICVCDSSCNLNATEIKKS